jgi:amino acid transporter
MVGAGPFITIPLLLGTMQGPQAVIGWIIGAVVALCDGLAWAELGAAIPQSGGSYVFLLECYGPDRLGRLIGFVSVWLLVVTMPLVFASGAVGFSGYAQYLFPAMTEAQSVALAMAVCLLTTFLVYRHIDGIDRLAGFFGLVVLAVGVWIVAEGLMRGSAERLTLPPEAFSLSRGFWVGLGGATLYAMYDYGGYASVCWIGGEVVRPARTIPYSIMLSVVIVSFLYLGMNFSIISVLPWREAMQSHFVVSDFIARLHGDWAAKLMTLLILIIILAGLFAGLLGVSRVPYAAAARGLFLKIFARLHPTGHFPSFSVLFIGVGSAFCCVFKLDQLIQAMLVISILGTSMPILGAFLMLRYYRRDLERPFRMWFFPAPLLVALAGWIYILSAIDFLYIAIGATLLAAGVAAYLVTARFNSEWPWGQNAALSPALPAEVTERQ